MLETQFHREVQNRWSEKMYVHISFDISHWVALAIDHACTRGTKTKRTVHNFFQGYHHPACYNRQHRWNEEKY